MGTDGRGSRHRGRHRGCGGRKVPPPVDQHWASPDQQVDNRVAGRTGRAARRTGCSAETGPEYIVSASRVHCEYIVSTLRAAQHGQGGRGSLRPGRPGSDSRWSDTGLCRMWPGRHAAAACPGSAKWSGVLDNLPATLCSQRHCHRLMGDGSAGRPDRCALRGAPVLTLVATDRRAGTRSPQPRAPAPRCCTASPRRTGE